MLKFKLLSDCDYDKSWISEVFNESDWPIRFIMQLQYMEDYDEYKYYMSIYAVSLEANSKKNIESVSSQYDSDGSTWDNMSDEWKYSSMQQYGIAACLFQKPGNNMEKLEREARKEMKLIQMLFGCYMDKQMNALENTGWDFIRGEIGFKVEN